MTVALPLIVGQGISGFGISKSKSKSKSISHCGLHESPVLVEVTVRFTCTSGSPPQGGGGLLPPPPFTVAVALPLMVGHGMVGFGIVKSKSKSKSISHCGLHESPVLLVVIVRLTLPSGSPPHGGGLLPPPLTVMTALPLIVGQGISGFGISKSKSKSKSISHCGLHESPVFVDVTTRLT